MNLSVRSMIGDGGVGVLLLWNTVWSVLPVITEAGNSQYCWFLHEDYHTVQQKYCANGCCRDYGDDDEICCFSWTVGVILGVAFACVTFITIVVVVVICCYHASRKRNRTGVVVTQTPNTTSTVVHTSAAYAYPHPPSGYYPTSQFPNALPAIPPPLYNDQTYNPNPGPPPQYTASVQPPYTPFGQGGSAGNTGPAPYGGYGQGQHAGNTGPVQYGGYGQGGSAGNTGEHMYGEYGKGS